MRSGTVTLIRSREQLSSDEERIRHLRAGLAAVVDRVGSWTAHNIEIAPGVFTRGDESSGEEAKLRRIRQLVGDLAPAPVSQLRVLDLGALEGLYGLELALSGSEVVFVEGREAAAERIRFALEALALERAKVITQDVQDLTLREHGEFDVVLCIGLLYHLDAPGVFSLLERMHSVCRGLLVLDTHIALEDDELARFPHDVFWVDPRALSSVRSLVADGRTYRGRDYREHEPGSSVEQRLQATWASLDNETSFWPTKPSLLNALVAAGFTTVLECDVPPLVGLPPDRVTLVAVAGERVELKSSSIDAALAYEPIPEQAAT
ncbi:MAG TPA: class I SAM-dependent methyltransferase [Solirubrobacteraceae bacterium]|nr:class I SAM-dependent methyltransferase [Solirubrobacteraceae bacterium]